jgi:ubiquinone/menaquinone biosynthesis C-methylase UbiE
MKNVREQREKVVPRAAGTVLEIGIGSGLNMAHYDKAKVTKIIGLDPSLQMQAKAKKRIADAGLEVELIGLSAEKIPLEDESVDTVLVTYTLCTIPEPVSALREMNRVLKPDGKLVFSEHGRAPDENVRRWQDRLTPYWKKLSGGCHLNRDILNLLSDGGFSSDDLQSMYLEGPRPMTFNYWGEVSKTS